MQFDCNLQFRIDNIVRKNFTKYLIFNIQALQGGLSSPGVYKFKNGNKEYVIRLSHPNRPISKISRTIKCYEQASRNGIAPPIKYTNVELGIIISKYINGHYVSKQDLLNNNLLSILAKTIKKLHNLEGFPLASKDIFAIRQSFEKKVLLLNSNLVLESVNYLKVIDKLIIKDKVTLVATHYDLKPENILYDNKFMIIDWEASGLGYPCFDLATILVFYNLSAHDQDKFLVDYYNRKLTLNEKKRITLFKQEVLGYYGMAYLMLSVYKKLPPLSSKEIDDLPELYDYLENKFSKHNVLDSYVEAQKFGWILLKKLNSEYHNGSINSRGCHKK